ncbi:TPA: rhodanese-like domain-containing protein [Candidatus Poribacteria bacterium]|nr:rhodanese-like domain-containing protein [Candidatus Poribacteria bacterium]
MFVKRVNLKQISPESLSKSLKTRNEKERTLVLMCRLGNRSRQVAEMLITLGLSDIHHLKGGLSNWKVSGFQVWQENSLAQSKSQDPFSFLGE